MSLSSKNHLQFIICQASKSNKSYNIKKHFFITLISNFVPFDHPLRKIIYQHKSRAWKGILLANLLNFSFLWLGNI